MLVGLCGRVMMIREGALDNIKYTTRQCLEVRVDWGMPVTVDA